MECWNDSEYRYREGNDFGVAEEDAHIREIIEV